MDHDPTSPLSTAFRTCCAVQLLLLFGNSTSQSIFCNRLCDLQANTTKQLLSIMLFDGVACNSATKPHQPPGKIKLHPNVCSDQS
jgi:hypothetical protein